MNESISDPITYQFYCNLCKQRMVLLPDLNTAVHSSCEKAFKLYKVQLLFLPNVRRRIEVTKTRSEDGFLYPEIFLKILRIRWWITWVFKLMSIFVLIFIIIDIALLYQLLYFSETNLQLFHLFRDSITLTLLLIIMLYIIQIGYNFYKSVRFTFYIFYIPNLKKWDFIFKFPRHTTIKEARLKIDDIADILVFKFDTFVKDFLLEGMREYRYDDPKFWI